MIYYAVEQMERLDQKGEEGAEDHRNAANQHACVTGSVLDCAATVNLCL